MRLSKNKVVKGLSGAYIAVFRSTPLLVQLSIIYFGLFGAITIPRVTILGFVDISRFIPGVVALALNSSAYVAEIFRGGILAVDIGQTEAGMALGLSRRTIFFKIVAPQAIKNIIPALGNEIITVIKETSIVSMVGMYDLNMAAKDIGSGQNMASYIVPMFVAALFYLATIYLITFIVKRIEKGLRRSDLRTEE
jgi:His/Glu/Gln/Arg/opine family amino acid ABC transporter permease subunit